MKLDARISVLRRMLILLLMFISLFTHFHKIFTSTCFAEVNYVHDLPICISKGSPQAKLLLTSGDQTHH